MSSFGEGIQATPLQLAALSAAFANGGTLYYLQYPHSQEEVENFTPRVKRELNIGPILPEIREGMLAAVLYGTGNRASTEAVTRCRSARRGPATTTLHPRKSAGSSPTPTMYMPRSLWPVCSAGTLAA